MGNGPHHSIGEVLSLLKDEHPDVTISKIRFLESQGLIEPERTPSGYRKFYQSDIERLRWILTQQRDNFLPLKVIKRRVAEEGFDPVAEIDQQAANLPLPEPSLFAEREIDFDPDDQPDVAEPQLHGAEEIDEDETSSTDPKVIPSGGFGSIELTAAELADASGADLGMVAELEKLGLIEGVRGDEGMLFDHEALLVVKAALMFRASGMEVRHLRMYKVAADREIGMLHQLRGAALTKGGSAAAGAREDLARLVAEGEAIHRSLVRRAFDLELDS